MHVDVVARDNFILSWEKAMRDPKQNRPKWISRPQLAAEGLVLVSHKPLVVQCQTCGVEWRPVRLQGRRWWRCQIGCNQSSEDHLTA